MNKNSRHRLVEILKAKDYSFRNSLIGWLLFSSNNDRNQIFNEIKNNGILKSKVSSNLYGNDLQRFNNIHWMYNQNLNDHDAIVYACKLINIFDEKIQRFCELRREYEKNLFCSNYLDAIRTLDKIDDETFISMWSCGQRFLIKEYAENLENNKTELSKIANSINDHIILNVLYYYSNLAEKGLSYDSYVADITNQLRKIPNKEISNYLYNKLLPESIFDSNNISLTIQLDSQISPIDLFTSLEKYYPAHFLNEICEGNNQKSIPIIHSINCNLFNNIRMLYGDYFYEDNAQAKYDIIEAFSSGNYETAVNLASSYLLNNLNDFTTATILCEAIILGELKFPETLNNSYIKSVFSIYVMDENYKESIINLKQELKKHHGTTIGIKIYNFLQNKYLVKANHTIEFVSEILEDFLHPRFSKHLKNDNFKNFISTINRFTPLSAQVFSCNLIDKTTYGYNTIPEITAHNINAKFYCKRENFSDAQKEITQLSKLLNVKNPYLQEMLATLQLEVYSATNNHLDATTMLVNIFYDNKYLFERLISSNIYSLPRRLKDNNIKSSIICPIFTFLIDNTDYSRLLIAYQNFLDLNNFQSILIALENVDFNIDKNALFFFSKVCTLNLLKRDVTLKTLNISPENARIQILSKILKSINSKEYVDEINNILTTETLKENLKSITKSRINMDDDKILCEHKQQWEEVYDKYLRISKINTSFIKLALENDDFILFSNIASQYNQQKTDQSSLLFENLIDQILDECLFNPKYGLETYLSSRIRHGYCKGQLTNFLSELHMLSFQTGDEDKYYSLDKYWEDKIGQDSSLYLQSKKAFSDFTKKVESKVDEILKKWLRIKYRKNQSGDFDYSNLPYLLHAYHQTPNKTEDFIVFYDDIIEAFWYYTENILKNIRSKIDEELREYYLQILGELQEDLQNICSENNIKKEMLNNCNVAKSKVVLSLGEFKEIFHVNNKDYNNFTMKNLLDSCKQLVLKLNNNTNLNWKTSADEYFDFDGKFFIPFVDVLCILLNNAIEHSGIEKNKKLQIEVDINQMSDKDNEILNVLPYANNYKHIFILKVSNSLNSTVDTKALKEKIDNVFNEIKKKESNTLFTQQEGGTGLYKLCNIAQNNIGAPYCVLYSVEQSSVTFEYCFAIDNILVREDNK